MYLNCVNSLTIILMSILKMEGCVSVLADIQDLLHYFKMLRCKEQVLVTNIQHALKMPHSLIAK